MSSVLDGDDELELDEELGLLELGVLESDEPLPLELLLDGELALPLGEVLEPAPAEPLIEPEAEPDGEVLEPEDEGELLDEDDEPDGDVEDGEVEDGELLELEDEPDGDVDVVPPRDALPLVRSHAVIRLAPSATETAMARVESFMEPP